MVFPSDSLEVLLKNIAQPKVILRNLRDNRCFINCPEPTSQQLSNKIAYMKKVNGLTEGMENTHQMRQKQHNTEPDNDLQVHIPCSEIYDEDKDEETKFVVILATKCILSFLNQGDTLHIDSVEWLSCDSLWSNRKYKKISWVHFWT